MGWYRATWTTLALGVSLILSGCASLPDSWREPLGMDSSGVDRKLDVADHPLEGDILGHNLGAGMARARQAEQQKDEKLAREIYERLIIQFKDAAAPRHALAVLADKQRRHREALHLYTEAARLDPRNPELLTDLGYCFFLQGQPEKAESALLKALQLKPRMSRAHNNIGLVYGHQGRLVEALDHFREAGSEADAQYNMAFIFATRNEVAKAKACFELALVADPTYEKARKALRSFQSADQINGIRPGELLAAEGNFVRFQEGAAGGQVSSVTPASHDKPASPHFTAVRNATRALHDQAEAESSRMLEVIAQ